LHDGDVQEIGGARSGLTRRRVLQGAVVAGGAVWAAPAVESFVTAAAAASAAALPFTYTLSAQQVASTSTGVLQLTVAVSFTNTDSAVEHVAFSGNVKFGATTKPLGLGPSLDVYPGSTQLVTKTHQLTGAVAGDEVTVTLNIAVQPLAAGQTKSVVKATQTVELS